MHPDQPFDVAALDRPSLLVDVQVRSGSEPARVVLTGELDGVTAARAHTAVIELLRQHRPSHIEVDLGAVPFLDTGGIRTLVLCRADAHQVDCRLTLTDPQRLVYQILRIVGLLQPFGLTGPLATGPAPSAGAGPSMRLATTGPTR